MSKKLRCFLKKFTQLTKILHDRRSRRSRQIPSLTLDSEGDIGTLFCWAENVVGQMKTPCRIDLLPFTPPSPPHSCTLFEPGTNSFLNNFEPGTNSFLNQFFHILFRSQHIVQSRRRWRSKADFPPGGNKHAGDPCGQLHLHGAFLCPHRLGRERHLDDQRLQQRGKQLGADPDNRPWRGRSAS